MKNIFLSTVLLLSSLGLFSNCNQSNGSKKTTGTAATATKPGAEAEPAATVVAHITEAVSNFAGTTEQSDDLTVVVAEPFDRARPEPRRVGVAVDEEGGHRGPPLVGGLMRARRSRRAPAGARCR